ncbi:hypothetical protein LSH36_1848g00000 [Paralvinella palmiformis]|uniref:Uncharacterized protein n=1 Tax=Paralvinella palmiformis TaxID=53620 RepID=A0AAD9IRJ2_9ANNE|nr:hypothetical protein LSH36_1848g00000 [Paralvinella palmiformis]
MVKSNDEPMTLRLAFWVRKLDELHALALQTVKRPSLASLIFRERSEISDYEDLHDYVSEDENGGGEPGSCNAQPHVFKTDESTIEDESTDSHMSDTDSS